MARYDTQVSSDLVNQIRAEAGLDAGFWLAFKAWITPLLNGDLGQSSVTGRETRRPGCWLDRLAVAIASVGQLLVAPLALYRHIASKGTLKVRQTISSYRLPLRQPSIKL